MDSEIVACTKNLLWRKNCFLKCQFFPKVCPSKGGLIGCKKAEHQQRTKLYRWSSCFEIQTGTSWFQFMYKKSFQKLSTDEWYPEKVMEEFRNFSVSSDKLLWHNINSFYQLLIYLAEMQKKFIDNYIKFTLSQKVIKIWVMTETYFWVLLISTLLIKCYPTYCCKNLQWYTGVWNFWYISSYRERYLTCFES